MLIPKEEIIQNLKALASSALAAVLYNPAGKKRRELLHKAIEIFTEKRGKDILCALVRHAGRPNEEKWIGKLEDFPEEKVDMSSLVILGNARTRFDGENLYEIRGYADKYDL